MIKSFKKAAARYTALVVAGAEVVILVGAMAAAFAVSAAEEWREKRKDAKRKKGE